MMGKLKDRWDSLNPNAKRGLTVAGVVACAMGVVLVIANFTPQPTTKADKQQAVKHLLTDTDPRSLGIDGLAAQLKQIAQKHDDLLRRLNALEEDQKRGRLSDEERLRRMNEEQANSHQGQIESLKSEIDGLTKAVWKSASSSRSRPRAKTAGKRESSPLDRKTRTAKPNRTGNCSSRLAAFCLATCSTAWTRQPARAQGASRSLCWRG